MSETLNKTNKIIRVVFAIAFGAIGLSTGLLFIYSDFYRMVFSHDNYWILAGLLFALTGFMVALGFFSGPFLFKQLRHLMIWWESRLIAIPAADLLLATLGVIIGLIIAFFLGSSLTAFPVVGKFLPLPVSIFLGYLGASIGIKKRVELLSTIGRVRYLAGRERKKDPRALQGENESTENAGDIPLLNDPGLSAGTPKLLDTSVIIDGRIADVYRTGFLSGELIVPGFVLTELQRVADSSDIIRRNRGRRGLDILNELRREMGDNLRVYEASFPDVSEVDSKLVMLARQIGCDILTNDYNLNKVAELQGIRVLNINDLVNALKQVFLPGEELTVLVLKEGKEQRQGIGYLDDGTMIVVENGRKYIGNTINTLVTSVLQTSAGRMIFVKPISADTKAGAEDDDR